ncbi:MAG: endonuclease domain-containing protein [Novosphingobium sp.]|uniref:endonuclease domain-containing protein n=1 Tax=Novosphingobium sp. TaxID=1874826 RepID=UPI003B9C5BE9
MKKTLTIRPASERTEAPNIQKKGRGWAISGSRLDAIHDTAREMRRDPDAAHTALADELAKEDLGKYKFKRFAVIGSAIVDFACQPLKLVVALNRDDNPDIERRRDASLAAVGLKVIRYDAADVAADPEGAARAVLAAMKARYEELRAVSRPQRPSYSRSGARPQRTSSPRGRG